MDLLTLFLYVCVWLGAGCLSVLIGGVLLQRYENPGADVTLSSLDNELNQEPSFAKAMIVCWPMFLFVVTLMVLHKASENRRNTFARWLESFRLFPDRVIVWPPSRWGVKAKSPRD